MNPTFHLHDKPPQSLEISAKLLSLYALNKNYFDQAEQYLKNQEDTEFPSDINEKLTRSDIDRLLSHIFVLEQMAKALYEEFLSLPQKDRVHYRRRAGDVGSSP